MKLISKITIALCISISGLVMAERVMAESESQLIKPISGEISVDLNGAVKTVTLNNFNDEKLEMYILESIRTWEFLPMNINGKPIEGSTGFFVNLIATFGQDDKLNKLEFNQLVIPQSSIEEERRISYEKIENDGKKKGTRSFIYPYQAMRIGAEANVIVAVDVTAEGTIKNAEVFSIELINSQPIDTKVLANVFGKNALMGIRKIELSNDQLANVECANGCIAKMNVKFAMQPNYNNAPGINWKTYIKVPIAPIPWVTDNETEYLNFDQSQLFQLKDDPTAKPIVNKGR